MTTSQPGEQDSHIKPGLTIKPEDYMTDRVIYKMDLFVKKSKQQKFWYQVTSIIGIICAASVPVLINLGVPAIVPTILSLVVAILVSSEKLFHFREHWRNYDSIAAFLRSEQLQFQTLSGVYKGKDGKSEDALHLFIRRIEEGLKEERNDTIEMRTKENE